MQNRLNALLSCLVICCFATTLHAAAPVEIRDQGKTVALNNGIVSFDITKTNGNIDNFKFGKTSLFAEAGYLDWVSAGNNHIGKGDYSVVVDPKSNNGEMVEIAITQKWDGKAKSPVDVELHYVLRRGDSGPYCFVEFAHPKDYPALSLDQARWVLRMDDKVFDFINVDESRRRIMPPSDTPAKVLGPKESSEFTEGSFKGFITDKYHFFVDAGDHFVHGWTGLNSGIGAWIVFGSNESQNGGPTKQHNTAHFGRMLFKILTCGHYGGTSVTVAAGQDWKKMYGPWMLYINSSKDNNVLWPDAKQKAEEQRAAWPLAWMRHPDYPLAGARGTVSGRIHLTDPQDSNASIAGAWVGLAPASPDWQKESNGYQFWVHADKDGRFTIPHIRPGEYTFYAFGAGIMDEFHSEKIKVDAGATVELATLDWTPKRYGKQLWQIGVPDRSADEFRHGDDYRQWGLWNKFPEDFPAGVNFEIGKSRERTDWNYAQVNELKDSAWVGTTWNILFNTTEPPTQGTAILRIAFASTHNAKLVVSVNGKQVDSIRTGADNAVIRAGIHGQYTEDFVVFDAMLLQRGKNTISLEQTAAGNAQKSVMYDCLRLELDAGGPFDKNKVPPRKAIGPAAPVPDAGD